MEYVNFGKAGVKVSRIALGLSFREQSNPSEAQKVVERAFDLGITFFDCANVYGPTGRDAFDAGHSEKILGRVIKGRRNEVVITTKVSGPVGTGPNDSGLSRYHIMREVERSLKHLLPGARLSRRNPARGRRRRSWRRSRCNGRRR